MYKYQVKTDTGFRTITTTQKLKNLPRGKCGVMISGYDYSVDLLSFTDVPCWIDNNGWLIPGEWSHKETPNHIKVFLEEFAPKISIIDFINCANSGKVINIYSKETVSRMEYYAGDIL